MQVLLFLPLLILLLLLQVVCEATQCEEMQVKVSALQCLVKIMSLYYQYMEAYMGQVTTFTCTSAPTPTPGTLRDHPRVYEVRD